MLQWICQLLLNASVTSIMKGIKKSLMQKPSTHWICKYSQHDIIRVHIYMYIYAMNYTSAYNDFLIIFGYMYVVLCLQHKSESAYHTILCINTILKCKP